MTDKIRIAAIDDEGSVLESYKLILSIKNYGIDCYEKATDFLTKFSKDMYDIIFLDLYLKKDPEPYSRSTRDGGIDVLKKVKEIDPDVEVIVVTGYGDQKTRLNAITLGAMEYLDKPFMMEVIYELVERALRKRRSDQAPKKDTGDIGPIH